MVDILEQERRRFEAYRRRIYRAAGAVSALITLYLQYRLLVAPSSSDYAYIAIYSINHICIVSFIIVTLWDLSRGYAPLELLERVMLFFLIFETLTFNSIIPLFFNVTPLILLRRTIGDDIWVILITCTFALHIYGSRKGLPIALGVYGLSFIIVAAQTAWWKMRGEDDGNGELILQVYVIAGILLTFMILLADSRHRMAMLHASIDLLSKAAFTDMVTGLPNRRRLCNELCTLIGEAERSGQPLCVCLFDLDHFKQINDRYGHPTGDRILQAVGHTVRMHLRAVDRFGRWGGEEFLIILPHTTLLQSHRLLDHIRTVLHTIAVGEISGITASFGLTAYTPGDSSETILHRADQALYAAKIAGRDRVVSHVTATQPMVW